MLCSEMMYKKADRKTCKGDNTQSIVPEGDTGFF